MTRDWTSFDRLEVFAPRSTATIAHTLRELECHWTRRTERSFTFGAASYLDATSHVKRRYARLARRLNPILATAFARMYARLAATLARTLSAPVGYSERWARPGFHIYRGGQAQAPDITVHDGAHWDWNLLALAWDPPLPAGLSPEHTLSFTLPIVLPASGSGLDVWPDLSSMSLVRTLKRRRMPVSLPNMRSLLGSRRFLARHASHRMSYRVGELVLHSGHVVHRSPPICTLGPGDERITLQGHGLCREGKWELFW